MIKIIKDLSFYSILVFFHELSRFTGQQRKEKQISFFNFPLTLSHASQTTEYSKNLGLRSIFARKDAFCENRAPKISPLPIQSFF